MCSAMALAGVESHLLKSDSKSCVPAKKKRTRSSSSSSRLQLPLHPFLASVSVKRSSAVLHYLLLQIYGPTVTPSFYALRTVMDQRKAKAAPPAFEVLILKSRRVDVRKKPEPQKPSFFLQKNINPFWFGRCLLASFWSCNVIQKTSHWTKIPQNVSKKSLDKNLENWL